MAKLVADVFDAVVIDNATGKVAATMTLQSSAVEVNTQTNDVRGGKGNQLIAILTSDRDVSVNNTDAEFKYDFLAVQLGQTIKTGAGVAYAMPKWYEVAGTKITLDETPLATNNNLAMFKADGTAITGTLSGKEVTFATGVSNGDMIEVRTYKYNTSAQTQTIEIDNSVFAKGCTLILETLEIDENLTAKAKIQMVFPNAVPTGTFTINTTSESSATTQDFNLRIVKPAASNVVGRVLRIPITA